jgi:hypothetical protein
MDYNLASCGGFNRASHCVSKERRREEKSLIHHLSQDLGSLSLGGNGMGKDVGSDSLDERTVQPFLTPFLVDYILIALCGTCSGVTWEKGVERKGDGGS